LYTGADTKRNITELITFYLYGDAGESFYSAYEQFKQLYPGEIAKVDSILWIFTYTDNQGNVFHLDLSNGVQGNDRLILFTRAYGILYNEAGMIRDNNLNGIGGEIADYILSMRFYALVYDFQVAFNNLSAEQKNMVQTAIFSRVFPGLNMLDGSITISELKILGEPALGILSDGRGALRDSAQATIEFFVAAAEFKEAYDRLDATQKEQVDYILSFFIHPTYGTPLNLSDDIQVPDLFILGYQKYGILYKNGQVRGNWDKAMEFYLAVYAIKEAYDKLDDIQKASADPIFASFLYEYHLGGVFAQNTPTGLLASHMGDFYTEDVAFTYDQALMALVFLIAQDFDSARAILDFYYNDFNANDYFYGFANAYHVGSGEITEERCDAGANAWIGRLMLQYMELTGDMRYMPVVEAIADWLTARQNEDGGIKAFPSANYLSTEHNISAYTFFNMLYQVTDNDKYRETRDEILQWIQTYGWNPGLGYFNRGYLIDFGAVDNEFATDVQALAITELGPAILAAMGVDVSALISTIEANAQVTVTYTRPDGVEVEVTGFDFGNPQALGRPAMIGPEWTEQMISAYRMFGDNAKADFYTAELEKMQYQGTLPYATAEAMPTGHGWNTPNGKASLSSIAYYIIVQSGDYPATLALEGQYDISTIIGLQQQVEVPIMPLNLGDGLQIYELSILGNEQYGILYDANGDLRNAEDVINDFLAASVMYQAILADPDAVAAFEYLSETSLNGQTVFYLIYDVNGNRQRQWNDPVGTIEYLKAAEAMHRAVSADPEAVAAFEKISGVKFTKQTVSYLIYDKDGKKQPYWDNPAAAIAYLKSAANPPPSGGGGGGLTPAASDMLKAIRANPKALEAFKFLTGQNLNTENVYTLLYDRQGKKHLFWNNPDATIEGLIAAAEMKKALQESPEAREAFKALTGVTIPEEGKLNREQIEALYTLIYKALEEGQTAEDVEMQPSWKNAYKIIESLDEADEEVIKGLLKAAAEQTIEGLIFAAPMYEALMA
ncbi:hypothetical protein ACFL1D_06020, partial [Candidatus Omnitrophota bacterium]